MSRERSWATPTGSESSCENLAVAAGPWPKPKKAGLPVPRRQVVRAGNDNLENQNFGRSLEQAGAPNERAGATANRWERVDPDSAGVEESEKTARRRIYAAQPLSAKR